MVPIFFVIFSILIGFVARPGVHRKRHIKQCLSRSRSGLISSPPHTPSRQTVISFSQTPSKHMTFAFGFLPYPLHSNRNSIHVIYTHPSNLIEIIIFHYFPFLKKKRPLVKKSNLRILASSNPYIFILRLDLECVLSGKHLSNISYFLGSVLPFISLDRQL